MIREERKIHINAPPDRVWNILTDIERWPEWTESIRTAEVVSGGEFGPGSSASLGVKGSPTKSLWKVTEFTPVRSFTWESTSMGVHFIARHFLDPDGDGTQLRLEVEISGFLATVLSPMFRSISKRNLEMEAEGLRRRAEASQE